MLPVAALIGLFSYSRCGFYPPIVFPLVVIIFGTSPIPCASQFFGFDVQLMSEFIVAINVMLVGAGIAIFIYPKATAGVVQ